jgi:Leucine-rich repeat (LRR) protein
MYCCRHAHVRGQAATGPQNGVSRPNRPKIPADVAQNTAEYASGRIADLMSLRGVSELFRGAVRDAIGFLNGKCFASYVAHDGSGETGLLWASRPSDELVAANRSAFVCMRHQLVKLFWYTDDLRNFGEGRRRLGLWLALFGGDNVTLSVLKVDARDIDADALRNLQGLTEVYARGLSGATCFDALPALTSLTLIEFQGVSLRGLESCASLRELRLEGADIAAESFTRLQGMLRGVEKLDLSRCPKLTSVSYLAACTSLQDLNLSYSGVADLRGLDWLPALETLDLRGTTPRNPARLALCGALTSLSADKHCAVPMEVLAYCATHIVLTGVDAESSGTLERVDECIVLRELDLKMSGTKDEDVARLATIATLEVLRLDNTLVEDVSALRIAPKLKELHLNETAVTSVEDLELIVTLEKLTLAGCVGITSVANLTSCPALRELDLDATHVTDAGIEGLEHIPTLTTLRLVTCASIATVSCLRLCACLRELDISQTMVTAEGIVGLGEVRTLETLKMKYCKVLTDVKALKGSRALRTIDLYQTPVGDESVRALGNIATLTSLDLTRCMEVSSVDGLGALPNLTVLMLSSTKVRDVTPLRNCSRLRRLNASNTLLTDAGVKDVELWPTLESLNVVGCTVLSDAHALHTRWTGRRVHVAY